MKSELSNFLPYLLNQAAETVSRDFQPYYKDKYGMLRTEWRVLFHLGCLGDMTAKEVCLKSAIHKTKVSRAVAALEKKRFLHRVPVETDRRMELLRLTKTGRAVFEDLSNAASAYDQSLETHMGKEKIAALKTLLASLTSTDDRTS